MFVLIMLGRELIVLEAVPELPDQVKFRRIGGQELQTQPAADPLGLPGLHTAGPIHRVVISTSIIGWLRSRLNAFKAAATDSAVKAPGYRMP